MREELVFGCSVSHSPGKLDHRGGRGRPVCGLYRLSSPKLAYPWSIRPTLTAAAAAANLSLSAAKMSVHRRSTDRPTDRPTDRVIDGSVGRPLRKFCQIVLTFGWISGSSACAPQKGRGAGRRRIPEHDGHKGQKDRHFSSSFDKIGHGGCKNGRGREGAAAMVKRELRMTRLMAATADFSSASSEQTAISAQSGVNGFVGECRLLFLLLLHEEEKEEEEDGRRG